MDKLPTQLTAWKIMKVLQEETDAEHPITQECLRKAIGNVDRKTVYRCLNESMRGAEDGEWFERKVQKTERGSVYYQGDFEPAEIRILIDSLLANKSINPRQSADLIDKLKTLLSKHQQKLLESSQVAKEWNKQQKSTAVYNTGVIMEAIEKGTVLSFSNLYSAGNGIPHDSVKVQHRVVPYQLALVKGFYYLIAFDEENRIVTLRTDLIASDLKATDEKAWAVPQSVREQATAWLYTERHPFMTNHHWDKQICVRAEIFRRNLELVTATFGQQIHVYDMPEKKGYAIVLFQANYYDAFIWAMQNADKVRITEPEELCYKLYMAGHTLEHKYRDSSSYGDKNFSIANSGKKKITI
mgnify:FL=1